MSLGDYSCGIGACGHDPVLGPSAPSGVQAGAVFIDASAKDAVLLPDGTFKATHPVDQAASLAMQVTFGTAGSVSGLGQAFRSTEYAGPDLEARVEDGVKKAWAHLVVRGDLEIVSIDVERTNGGFNAAIAYRNLRLLGGPSALQTLTVKG